MKSNFTWIGLLLIILMMPGCAGDRVAISTADKDMAAKNTEEKDVATNNSDGAAAKSSATIADIQGRDWFLAEVKSGSGTVRIDRTRSGAEAVYTIRFEADRFNGVGAPNRYFAPYTSGDANSLSMGLIAGTLMAPLFENPDLREHAYFGYLSRVKRWALQNQNLELYTSDENGGQVVLIYR